jgi:hypothetical protein
MTAKLHFYTPGTRLLISSLALAVLLGACAPEPAFTPFVPPPNQTALTPTGLALDSLPTLAASPTALPTSLTNTPAPTGTPEACTNDLTFNQDLTIPDGAVLTPGSTIDKQWQVTNSGTCNWDSAYRFKLIFGEALGASTEQALYPARAGTQVALRVAFLAPLEEGTYQSAWQAFGPDGLAFGDAVFMQIIVSP